MRRRFTRLRCTSGAGGSIHCLIDAMPSNVCQQRTCTPLNAFGVECACGWSILRRQTRNPSHTLSDFVAPLRGPRPASVSPHWCLHRSTSVHLSALHKALPVSSCRTCKAYRRASLCAAALPSTPGGSTRGDAGPMVALRSLEPTVTGAPLSTSNQAPPKGALISCSALGRHTTLAPCLACSHMSPTLGTRGVRVYCTSIRTHAHTLAALVEQTDRAQAPHCVRLTSWHTVRWHSRMLRLGVFTRKGVMHGFAHTAGLALEPLGCTPAQN